MNNQEKTYKVLQKSFPLLQLLNINSYISITYKNNSTYPIFKEKIFLEFSESKKNITNLTYDVENKLSIRLDTYELRQFSYACKELFKKRVSSYEKKADPKKAGSEGTLKILSLKCVSTNNSLTFFVNLNDSNKKRYIAFSAYEFAAFIDTLSLIAENTDKFLFYIQKKIFNVTNK